MCSSDLVGVDLVQIEAADNVQISTQLPQAANRPRADVRQLAQPWRPHQECRFFATLRYDLRKQVNATAIRSIYGPSDVGAAEDRGLYDILLPT